MSSLSYWVCWVESLAIKITRFEDNIEVWQEARKLVNPVYEAINASETFARDFRLVGQIQDAAGSSKHNIAEGFDSETSPEFVRFLSVGKSLFHNVTLNPEP